MSHYILRTIVIVSMIAVVGGAQAKTRPVAVELTRRRPPRPSAPWWKPTGRRSKSPFFWTTPGP